MDWFYAYNNRQNGPVTGEALTSMLRQGHIQPGDLVWREGMANWQPAGTIPELSAGIAAPNAALGYFNPVVAAAGEPIYAGFWLRFVAAIIDGVLLFVIGAIIDLILGGQRAIYRPPGTNTLPLFYVNMFTMHSAVRTVIDWLYFALMESSKFKGTLGKMALGLVVTDMAGQPIVFGRATGRYFGKYISVITLCIGYMMAGWTQQKQALHDIMAGCLVLRKN